MPVPKKSATIRINNKEYEINSGDTIKNVADRNNIMVPGLCHHPDFRSKGNCRLCLVELKDVKKLSLSCSTPAQSGMEVFTETARVKRARNINLEMIFAEHIEKCPTCVWRYECQLLDYARRYKVAIGRFKDRKGARKKYKFGNAVEIDGTQCIDCRNCVDACSLLQSINYLEIRGKGANQEIAPVRNKKKHCILCGQCALHCPVSAAQEQTQWELVENEMANKKKVVVVQFAPSIRVSIGEDFGLPYGKIMTGNLVTALRQLGFKYVFDVNFSADVTTIVEAEELIERLQTKKGLPMFTSCCPGWINYVEHYRPDLIPNLTTSRSPQIHGGGIIKTYWAKKMKIDPKNIVVVSIMPCTAKKYEASRKEMKINGVLPVDYVLTTRELTFMLKKNSIDLGKVKESKADDPLAEFTGGAAIFGATGGVMESALRTAQHILTTVQAVDCAKTKKSNCVTKIDFVDVRGLQDVKEATINIAGNQLKIAVTNGIGNIHKLLERLPEYHYIEVMACPGGCIGGGGQPIPTTPAIRQKRLEALYKVDKGQSNRVSYENQAALSTLQWLEENKLKPKTMFTKYKKKINY